MGAVISGVSVYHMATGIPLMQGSKFRGGEHVASGSELLIGIFGGLPFLLLGLVIVLTTLNCTVTVDGDGIYATNMFRRKSFQASWSEVTGLVGTGSKSGVGHVLRANGKEFRILTSIAGMKELVAEIERRAPNLPGAK